jgi:hypothetical protein
MPTNLEITNFKSIKHLNIDCKRINLFIGEPNTGKSNILEALGIISSISFGGFLSNWVRIERLNNLFHDEDLREDIKIRTDNLVFIISFKEGKFLGKMYNARDKRFPLVTFDYALKKVTKTSLVQEDPTKFFKFYKFKVLEEYPKQDPDFLFPPFGTNLLAILKTHEELKRLVKLIFDKYGLKVVLKPQENKIEVQKEIAEDVVIAYPYSLVSDTLQRIIFHLAAIETNENAVLVFEEPEAHAFPYYTKYLAERIALDKNNNQYFISTHNPYLLLSILEKAPKDNVGIFITYFEDYQTRVKPLREKELVEIMDLGLDLFFNIERYLEIDE